MKLLKTIGAAAAGVFFIACSSQKTSESISVNELPIYDSTEDQSPTWSPDGSEIIFYTYRFGAAELMRMNSDGTNLRRITNDDVHQWYPDWSKDGKKIVYSSDAGAEERFTDSEIYIMNVDGTGVKQLTDGEGVWNMFGSLSPDGSKIVYVHDALGAKGGSEIHIMNVDGSEKRNLTNNDATDRGPGFSPSGDRISFFSNRNGEGAYYSMNLDGSNVQRLFGLSDLPDMRMIIAASWSPDESFMVITGVENGQNEEVYKVDLATREVRNLSNHPETEWAGGVSPDGKKMAFITYRYGQSEVFTMNIDGSNQQNLTRSSAHFRFPNSLPDKDKLVFISKASSYDEVYLSDKMGRGLVQLTSSQSAKSNPRLSPDGSKVVFEASVGEGTELFLVDIATKHEIQLTTTDYKETVPSWAPDGESVLFTREIDGKTSWYQINLENRQVSKVYESDYSLDEAHWSPNGRHLTFVAYQGNETFQIATVDANGENFKLITAEDVVALFPSWSPDGSKIAFCGRLDGTKGLEIYVAEVKTGKISRITTDEYYQNSRPVWVSENYLVYESDKHSAWQLFSVNLETKESQRITKVAYQNQ